MIRRCGDVAMRRRGGGGALSPMHARRSRCRFRRVVWRGTSYDVSHGLASRMAPQPDIDIDITTSTSTSRRPRTLISYKDHSHVRTHDQSSPLLSSAQLSSDQRKAMHTITLQKYKKAQQKKKGSTRPEHKPLKKEKRKSEKRAINKQTANMSKQPHRHSEPDTQ